MKLNINVFAAVRTWAIPLLFCFLFQGDPQCKVASSLLLPCRKVQRHKKRFIYHWQQATFIFHKVKYKSSEEKLSQNKTLTKQQNQKSPKIHIHDIGITETLTPLCTLLGSVTPLRLSLPAEILCKYIKIGIKSHWFPSLLTISFQEVWDYKYKRIL